MIISNIKNLTPEPDISIPNNAGKSNLLIVRKSLIHLTMSAKRYTLLLILLSIYLLSFSQKTSKDNYSGSWLSPTTWQTTWNSPKSSGINEDIEIYGKITRNGDLKFGKGNLTIHDTLIITGLFSAGNDNNIIINPGGVLIVYGDAEMDWKNYVTVLTGGYFIVMGDLKFLASWGGYFHAEDSIPNIFLSNVTPAGITNNDSSYTALNCASPAYPYPSSGCTYGDTIDLASKLMYSMISDNLSIPPSIDLQPIDTFTCSLSSVTFSIMGSNVKKYKWQVDEGKGFKNIGDSINYTGVREEILILNNPPIAYDSNLYRCIIYGLNKDSIISDEVILRVYETPKADPGVGGTSCDYTFNLNADTSSPGGNWSQTSGPGVTTFNPDETTPNAIVTVSDTGTYEYTWTVTNGICLHDSTIEVTFFAPAHSEYDTIEKVCGLTYSLTGAPEIKEGTFNLISGPGAVAIDQATDTSNIRISASEYGSYVLNWELASGVCGDDFTLFITFSNKPGISINASDSVCGLEYELIGQPPQGTMKAISGPGNVNYTSATDTTNATISVSDYGQYQLCWTGPSICTDSFYLSATFFEIPMVTAGTDESICGLEYELIASQHLGDGYWSCSPHDGMIEFNPDSSSQETFVTVETPGLYEFTRTGIYGMCVDSAIINVEFLEVPQVNAGDNQEIHCSSEAIMQASLETGTTGEWQTPTGAAIIKDKHLPNTKVQKLEVGDNIFYWVVDNGKCQNSEQVIVTVCDLIAPTIITPNGDNKNDYFVINNIEEHGTVKLIIFDKSGREVFNSNNYSNDWNGIDKNGNILQEGTYYYIVKIENHDVIKNYVLIKR